MPLQYVSQDNIGTGLRVDLGSVNQLIVGDNGVVSSTDDTAVSGTGANHVVDVLGSISGGKRAISLGDDSKDDYGNVVMVRDGGFVGTHTSNVASVELRGYHSQVVNDGIVSNLYTSGIAVKLTGFSSLTDSEIVNRGEMSAGLAAILHDGTERLNVRNSGRIDAKFALVDGDGIVTVSNTGTISGEIYMGGGADYFDTRNGKITAAVSGDQGNDVLHGGAGSEKLLGGSEDDRLYGYGGADSLLGETGKDTIYGGSGNDLISGGSDDDVLRGDAGKDKIEGGTGKDRIWGGTEADQFVFRTGQAGTTRASADTILDFSSVDDIDLSLVDADSLAANDQAFKFVGTQGFHGVAGELRYVKEASDTYIYGDTNGDKKADLVIHLDDAVTLTSSQFVL